MTLTEPWISCKLGKTVLGHSGPGCWRHRESQEFDVTIGRDSRERRMKEPAGDRRLNGFLIVVLAAFSLSVIYPLIYVLSHR